MANTNLFYIEFILLSAFGAGVCEYTDPSSHFWKRWNECVVIRTCWPILVMVILFSVFFEEYMFRQLFWDIEAALQKDLAVSFHAGDVLVSLDSCDFIFQIMPHLSSALFVLYHEHQIFQVYSKRTLAWAFVYVVQMYTFGCMFYLERNFWKGVGIHVANNVCVMLLTPILCNSVEKRWRWRLAAASETTPKEEK